VILRNARATGIICRRFEHSGTECSETSAYKIHTPGNYPEESLQYSEHGESLKSRIILVYLQRLLSDGSYSLATYFTL